MQDYQITLKETISEHVINCADFEDAKEIYMLVSILARFFPGQPDKLQYVLHIQHEGTPDSDNSELFPVERITGDGFLVLRIFLENEQRSERNGKRTALAVAEPER